MMANGNMIVPYVLDPLHPKRLEIAIEIVKSFPQIKSEIICDFATRLASQCAIQFPAFTVESSLKNYGREPYGYLAITKPAWKEGMSICLEAQNAGLRDFVIGVQKSEESGGSWPELFAGLHEQYGSGRSNQWWYYYRRITKFADWNHDTLRELCKPSTLDFFVDEFDHIRGIAEPMIDYAMSGRRA